MLEICVQSGNWYQENDPEGSFAFIRECGFESIDYNIDQFLPGGQIRDGNLNGFFDKSVEELLEYYRPVKAAAEKNHVKFSQMHAPFPLYVEGREDSNDYLIMVVDKCCAICQYLECPALIVHPYSCEDKEKEIEINLNMYRRMMPSGLKYDITLCLENMFVGCKYRMMQGSCSDVSEVCWYIDKLNEEAGKNVFGYCFDVGHAILLGRNINQFIRGLGKRLTNLHIHENAGMHDSHLIPYTQAGPGSGVDWEGFVESLVAAGYTGPLSFETFNGIDLLPPEVRGEGLKLVSAIGRTFRNKMNAKKNA